MSLVKPDPRTPHGEQCAVMYRWPWEQGEPEDARVIWCPLAQVAWRKSCGWRLVLSDAEIELTLWPGQEWARPNQAKYQQRPTTFYPPQDEDYR